MRCDDFLSRATIVVWFTLLAAVACEKKQQPEQKTAPPTALIPDTLAFMPPDTMTMEPIKPEVVSSPDGKYTVQVSSWQTRRKAEKEAERFRAEGYDAYVQAAYLEDRRETWYRVRIGRYASSEDAAQVAGEIRNLLESGFWIDRIRPGANH
jgi:cell division protein FtsN